MIILMKIIKVTSHAMLIYSERKSRYFEYLFSTLSMWFAKQVDRYKYPTHDLVNFLPKMSLYDPYNY